MKKKKKKQEVQRNDETERVKKVATLKQAKIQQQKEEYWVQKRQEHTKDWLALVKKMLADRREYTGKGRQKQEIRQSQKTLLHSSLRMRLDSQGFFVVALRAP